MCIYEANGPMLKMLPTSIYIHIYACSLYTPLRENEIRIAPLSLNTININNLFIVIQKQINCSVCIILFLCNNNNNHICNHACSIAMCVCVCMLVNDNNHNNNQKQYVQFGGMLCNVLRVCQLSWPVLWGISHVHPLATAVAM